MSGSIQALLRPRSIARLGASADFQKLNGRTLKALVLCSADGVAAGELDLNPVLRSADGVAAVDWMLVLQEP
jgi:hypothetical protein